MDMNLARRALAEFIGTFSLVFAGCAAIVSTAETGGPGGFGIAFTFGLTLFVMVASLGHISGAHFNPAVSIAFTLSGKLEREVAPFYIGAQVAAGIVAALILYSIFGDSGNLGATQTAESIDAGQAMIIEVILTFFLMFVITAVATDGRAAGNLAPLAIGFTVLLDALWGGGLTGASMNPARSFGPAVISGTGSFEDVFIYGLAPVIGAIIATFTYEFLRGEE